MITFRQTIQDGGEGFTKLVTIDLTSSTEDPAFFVIQKSSTAARTTAADNAELFSIASPEDMRIYYTSEVYTSKYRTASAFFGFSTMSKMTAATAAIMQDLRNAITANRITFNTATAYTSRYTAGTSPVFGV